MKGGSNTKRKGGKGKEPKKPQMRAYLSNVRAIGCLLPALPLWLQQGQQHFCTGEHPRMSRS